jgi:hypothetical protein
LSIDGATGDSQAVGSLFGREAAEEAKVDDGGRLFVFRRQLLECFVERDDVFAGEVACRNVDL